MQIPEITCTRKTGRVQSIETASAAVLHTRARFNDVQELCGGPRGSACSHANNGRGASRKSRGGASLSPGNFNTDGEGGGRAEWPDWPHIGQCSAFRSCDAGSVFEPTSADWSVNCSPGSIEMRSTPRVVQTSITIGEPVGAENLTIACEMVGMNAMAIMAQSAAQTPTRSTIRDNLEYKPLGRHDGRPMRGARLDISGS